MTDTEKLTKLKKEILVKLNEVARILQTTNFEIMTIVDIFSDEDVIESVQFIKHQTY